MATLVAVLGLASLSGCEVSQEASHLDELDRPATSAPPLSATDPVDAFCDSQPGLLCLETVTGARGVVIRAHGQSRGLVWWDPGGPGLGLPDAETSIRRLVPAGLSHFDLLLPVEKWVSSPPSQSCLESAAGPGRPSSCNLESLALHLSEMRALLRQGVQRLGEPPVGAYLQSFGATRSAPLLARGGGSNFSWAVLESPGPPGGTAARKVLEAREQSVEGLFVDACPTVACRSRAHRVLTRWATYGHGREATGREVALGLIAVATLPESNAPFVERLGREIATGELSASDAGSLRRVGRLFEGREVDTIVPSRIGLWADTCPRLDAWEQVGRGDRGPFMEALNWVYRACGSSATRQHPEGAVGKIAVPTLLLSGTDDTIVPPQLQNTWIRHFSVVRRLRGTGHFWDSSRTSRLVRQWITGLTPQDR